MFLPLMLKSHSFSAEGNKRLHQKANLTWRQSDKETEPGGLAEALFDLPSKATPIICHWPDNLMNWWSLFILAYLLPATRELNNVRFKHRNVNEWNKWIKYKKKKSIQLVTETIYKSVSYRLSPNETGIYISSSQ